MRWLKIIAGFGIYVVVGLACLSLGLFDATGASIQVPFIPSNVVLIVYVALGCLITFAAAVAIIHAALE